MSVPVLRVARGADGELDARQLELVVSRLEAKEVVGLPTDTVYGLAAKADDVLATELLFEMKGRRESSNIAVLVGALDQAEEVWELDDRSREQVTVLAQRFWPGALTMVVKRNPRARLFLGEDTASVGVRWPDHFVPSSVARMVGPLATTSANFHGEPPLTTPGEIAGRFAERAGLGLVVDAGPLSRTASSVVDLTTGGTPKCLREGSVPFGQILEALGDVSGA